MSELKIYTNYHWRQFKYRYEVPKKVLKDGFDWMEGNEDDYIDGFFQYRGLWYHASEFMRLEGNHNFPGNWHGYSSDSYFSGVLIEISDDGEAYRIATYIS